jgi:hypothetical protein
MLSSLITDDNVFHVNLPFMILRHNLEFVLKTLFCH